MNISQHNVTQLYDVSISSSIPFPDGESNVTIFCVLQIESMEAELFSQPLPIGKVASQDCLFHQVLHINVKANYPMSPAC
jgi:hypothetical protein